MKEYEPNVENLKYIVEKAYFAITGNNDEQMKKRLYAGVEAMVKLYEENPNAFYALAAVSLLEGTERLGLRSPYATLIAKYLAQSMVEESGYDPKNNNKKKSLDLGGN